MDLWAVHRHSRVAAPMSYLKDKFSEQQVPDN